ncbi:DNA-binding protein SMUBP-2 [Phytophthora nicotianae]|nr:DNA-binding protein SMUBP-2 [Phytophthora nicotianae]
MDEQLVMSLSVAASTAPTTSSSKSAADTKATKTTKLKQVKKSNKALKAAAGASKVVEAKKAAPNDENPQAMEAKETIATVTLDEEKEKDEVEDKPVAVKSVFQMMNSDSDSSDDENEEGNIDPGEEGSSSLTEDLKAANSLLKDLHMSRLARQPPPAPTSSKKKKKNKKKKGQPKTVNTAPIDDLKDGEDELEFLTRQANKSSNCAFQSSSRCKKNTTMLGSVCKFCKLKFCYDHALPEVHGCGDAVRKFERAAFQQQMTRSSDVSNKKLTGDKRKLLKKKLDEKVSAKTASRTTKSKKK